MKEELLERIEKFLESLLVYGYEWYSVHDVLSAGAYATMEERVLVELFKDAERLKKEIEEEREGSDGKVS